MWHSFTALAVSKFWGIIIWCSKEAILNLFDSTSFFFYYFANSDCHFWTVSFLLTCEKGDQFCLRGQLVSSVTTQSRSSQSHVITFLRNKSTLTSLERLRTGFMWFALWLYCNRMGDLQCRKAQQVNSHLHLCPNIV